MTSKRKKRSRSTGRSTPTGDPSSQWSTGWTATPASCIALTRSLPQPATHQSWRPRSVHAVAGCPPLNRDSNRVQDKKELQMSRTPADTPSLEDLVAAAREKIRNRGDACIVSVFELLDELSAEFGDRFSAS